MIAATRLRVRLAGEAPAPEFGEVVPSRLAEPYRAIREYGLIGDCHGAALVARDGGIDWACIGRFDADPVFARLVDAERGGSFELTPAEPFAAHRRYRPCTNILETEFATEQGRVRLVDFMPVGRQPGQRLRDYSQLNAPGWIIRRLTGVAGRVPLRMRCCFAPPFGGKHPAPRPTLYASMPCESGPSGGSADFEIGPCETALFILAPTLPQDCDLGQLAQEMERTTQFFWEEWVGSATYRGPYQKTIRRSALALKLMTYAPTGAIVAAPTTSLPEQIGGQRNWDYRYCWLRDGAFTLYALAGMGFTAAAHSFVEFLRACQFERRTTRLMYGITGETDLHEHDVSGLEGYRGSSPVRIGNAAHKQEQLDMFGEVLDLALLYQALGGSFDRNEEQGLAALADQAVQHWTDPDNSIWETRAERRHYVYSKIMCWVAFDRAIRLFGKRESWVRARDEVCREVHEKGLDPTGDHLVQYYGAKDSDASLLFIPWTDFPLDRALLHRTVSAIIRELREGDYVRRYRTEDGLSGEEGCFITCSFWLADALLYLDHPEQAQALYERMLLRVNDLGLLSEEIDPRTHAFLGNFPQALAHLAVANSALRFDLYRRYGRKALEGTHADRARRYCASTHGMAATLGRLRQRLVSSQSWLSSRSVLSLP